MTDVDKPDYATLRWVKEGLDETVHSARQALEAYLESQFKGELLVDVLSSVHRILGTLRMVQAYGAAMLAEEMELVAKGLANGSVVASERIAESLMLGLIQLPSYLARLESGEPDVPVMLLPVINDLRTARNAPPASEISSYAPNLDRLIDTEPVTPGSGSPAIPALIKRYRNRFHRGLLHWYKDDGKEEGLRQVLDVVTRVNAAAGTARLRRLMEAIEALVIVLVDGEFNASDEVKKLFSRVDRLFKQLQDEGEEATVIAFPMELLKHLLYFIARSHSHDSVVNGVKRDAELANSFPEDISNAGSAEGMAGKDILEAVKDVLLADIETVKDELDLYIRGDHSNTKRLLGLPEILNRIGDTLGMVGRGSLRYRLQFCRDKLAVVADKPDGLSEDDLMSVATELVAVEEAVGVLSRGKVEDSAEAEAETAAQINLEHVLKEAQSELNAIKEASEKYIREGDAAQMTGALDTTHRLASVFAMIGLDEPAQILTQVEPQLHLIAEGSRVTSEQRQALVDLYAALDYYVESRLDHRGNLPALLEVMQQSLAELQQIQASAAHAEAGAAGLLDAEPSETLEDILMPAAEGLDLDESPELEAIPSIDEVQSVELEAETVELEPMEPDQTSAKEGAKGDEFIEVDSEGSAVEHAPELPAEPVEFFLEEIDPEIFDIFIEEATEELESIRQNYPLWRADHSNEEALKVFRRSFHTLKGSGRMVGAATIGEFAWSIENLLNRVLDGRVPPTSKVVHLMDSVLEVLPVLVDAQANRKALTIDLEDIKALAFGYTDGSLSVEDEVSETEPVVGLAAVEENADQIEAVSSAETLESIAEQIDDALATSGIAEPLEEPEQLLDLEQPEVLFAEESAPLALSESDLIVEETTAPESIEAEPVDELESAEVSSSLLADLAPDVSDSMLEDLVITPYAEDEKALDEALPAFDFEAEEIELVADAGIHAVELSEQDIVEMPEADFTAELAVEAPEPIELSAEAFEISSAEGAVAFGSQETLEPEAELVAEPAAVTELAKAPIELPDDLYEIFCSESESHLLALSNFVDRCAAEPQEISEEIVRAVHTLRGSSHLAGVDSMAELAGKMEAYANHLRRAGIRCEGTALDLVRRFRQLMADTLHAINVPGAQIPDHVPLMRELDVAEHQLPEVVSELNEPKVSQPILDPELLEIFLEEAAEVAERIEDIFGDWANDIGNMDLIDGLKRELHTLKGGARLAGVAGLGDLTHALESLYVHLQEKGAPVGIDVPRVARTALDEMENALDLLHLDGKVPDLSVATKRLQEALLGHPAETSVAEAEAEISSDLDAEAADESSEAMESILLSDGWDDEDSRLAEEPYLQLVPSDKAEPSGQPAAGSEAPKLDVDPELLGIFLEEAGEIIENLEVGYNDWSSDLGSKEAIDQLMRSLHTIKGNARFAGLFNLGDLCHALETLFEQLAEGNVLAESRLTQLVRRALDLLGSAVDQLQQHRPVSGLDRTIKALEAAGKGQYWDVADLASVMLDSRQTESLLHKTTTQLLDDVDSVAATKDSSFIADSKLLTDSELFSESQLNLETNAEIIGEGAVGNIIPFPEREKIDYTRPSNRPPPMQAEETADGNQQERVRVLSGLLDQLVNNAGEVSIYRARLEQQNNRVNHNLSELNDTIGRLRIQLRALELETEAQVLSRHERKITDQRYEEFDPLEMDRYSTIQQLSRALSETINDLSNIGETLEELSRDTDTLLLQQARISNDLQDGLLRTRMVPFDSQSTRLQRVVRQTAQTLGKNAVLEIQGAEGEIDRTILNRMLGPLEHLLRNAVAHGIEMPEVRRSTDKPDQGKVTLRLSREGTEIVLTLTDDGAGLNPKTIREKAIAKGLLEPDAEVSDDEIYQFILKPGFTTIDAVTQVAGRGVGMDVVLSEVKQLGGTLEMDSQPGRGSSFIIRLPFTLAITEALLVKVMDEIYAIPHGSVEIIIRARRQELLACYTGKHSGIESGGKEYPVRYLGSMLGLAEPTLPSTSKWFPVLLARVGDQRVAIQVDHLIGNFQVVVKGVGSQLSGVRWFTGGTILADGKIALLLDLATLVRGERVVQKIHAPKEEERAGITVMVVDDSITVRKVTSRLLERHNMTVLTAKDGVDAVTILQDHKPDVMLLDIEMPRMDGYELARHIRHTPELKHIPIIMITSRTGDKHRQRAMDLGVNRYLGKPYQEADLLDNIYTLLAEHAYE